MSDVLNQIDAMVERMADTYGPVHKQETTQHEKHLTWVTSYYAQKLGLPCSDDIGSNRAYFGQDYNNLTFKIGYRIGVHEGMAKGRSDYKQGYEDAMSEVKSLLEGKIDV